MGRLLESEPYHALSGMLQAWRTDPFYQMMEKEGEEGRVLGFVKGLRLSAQLVYILRSALSSSSLEVDWGHLIDDKEQSCSSECDIIIHRPGHFHKWNGHENPIMDFRFIKCSTAVAIISCKSFLKSVDRDYCRNLKKFKVRNTLLFAECCFASSVQTLANNARRAGYKAFCYIYTIDPSDTSIVSKDERVYLGFLKTVRDLVGTNK